MSRLRCRFVPPTAVTAVTAAAVVAAAAGAALSPLGGADATAPPAARARSVIFINGDGMAAAQREAGRLYLQGVDGRLQMDRLPVSGQLTTDPRDPKTVITDSAAGASAWTTGRKTYNGAISVDVDGRELPIPGELAKSAGKSTGLVTSAQVTDATPAAFFAQVPERGLQDEIARQYLEESRPDVILGGGEDWWLPAGTPGSFPDNPAEDPTEASKGTKGNLVEEAKGLGYQYVTTRSQLTGATGDKLLGLFSNEELFQQRPEGQGDVYDPAVEIATMTKKALETLDRNKKGFLLLIEEEGVDEFAHSNNAEKMLLSMRRLEAAVVVARQYVAEHPDTLLVITGDHECGGLTVEDTSATDESGDGVSAEDGPFPVKGTDLSFRMDWATTGHTGVPVPLTAVGPGSQQLTGQHPNTYVHEVLSQALRR